VGCLSLQGPFWFCCHLLACLYIVHNTNGWSRKMLNCCSVILLCHPSTNKYEHKKAACHKVSVQDNLSHDLSPTCYSAAHNVKRQWAAIKSKIIQLQTFLFRKFRSLQYPTTIRCCIDTIASPVTLDLLHVLHLVLAVLKSQASSCTTHSWIPWTQLHRFLSITVRAIDTRCLVKPMQWQTSDRHHQLQFHQSTIPHSMNNSIK
jgi:hypothetical protein